MELLHVVYAKWLVQSNETTVTKMEICTAINGTSGSVTGATDAATGGGGGEARKTESTK